MALDDYYHNKIEAMKLEILKGQAGQEVNVIAVDPETERWAKVALQRMLDLPGKTPRP